MSFIFNLWEFEQQATNDTDWLVNDRRTPMTQTHVGALLADGDTLILQQINYGLTKN